MLTRVAGCIITDQHQKLLLLHRNKNGKIQWKTPGGKVEVGESDKQAALRELKEEIGVTVKIVNKIGESDFQENEKTYHYVWFAATLVASTAPILLEHGFDDFGYFSVDELHQMQSLLSAGTKKFLELSIYPTSKGICIPHLPCFGF